MINYHVTPQFKTNVLFQTYRFTLAKEARSNVAMLARMFQYGIEQFPSKRELKNRLELLYNVQFATGVERDGTSLVLTFTLTFPEYRFVGASGAFDDAITLFQQLIEQPYFMTAANFDTEFEQERHHLIEQIKSVYDDKTQYAFTQLQTRLLSATPYFEDITGTEEMVGQVSLDAVRNCWKTIQNTAEIDVYATVAKDETGNQLTKYLTTRKESSHHTETTAPISFVPFSFVETQQVTQAKVNFAFQSDVKLESPDYFASLLATSILGGGSQSKLFQNVREKQSLAYYANAIADSNSGLMYIYSGVSGEKIDEATQCIFDQIKAMQNGDVTDDEINLTKKVMINGLRESLNRPMGIIQFERKLQKHANLNHLEAYIAEIERVTKKEIVDVAAKWQHCGTFILKGDA